VNKKDAQYTKISDSIFGGLLFGGLALYLLMIKNTSIWLGYLIMGTPCIIIGALKMLNCNIYYDHRISNLKWMLILLMLDFLVATVLFLVIAPNIQKKGVPYLLTTTTIIILIIIFIKKIN
jgi:ABC-type uncharacterized transport system permease subunit